MRKTDCLMIGLFLFVMPAFAASGITDDTLIPEIMLGEFGAFHTKVNSGEGFEEYSRTGPYADIVVDLGAENGAVVFWRGTSYLPYLITPAGKKYSFHEVVPRKGDGDHVMPDRTNTYSVVKIIENTPQKVVVRSDVSSSHVPFTRILNPACPKAFMPRK